MISHSTVYVIDNGFTYPKPNQYAEINQVLTSVGGEAINSAIVLSKLGLRTKFDGNWVNKKNAEMMFNLLSIYNIDLSRLTVKTEGGTEEIVITDKNSRTVFGNYAKFHSGEKQWNKPFEDDIIHAEMVCLDPYFRDDSLNVAETCVKHNKPYVTLDCKFDDYIAINASAIIISHELRDQAYPGNDLNDIFNKYLSYCKGLIIFTFGSNELWYARKGKKIKKYKPYKITPVDTTGAGDSFRAAIAYGLMKFNDDYQIVDFASAVAACVCLTVPHALNAPDLDSVLEFMKRNVH